MKTVGKGNRVRRTHVPRDAGIIMATPRKPCATAASTAVLTLLSSEPCQPWVPLSRRNMVSNGTTIPSGFARRRFVARRTVSSVVSRSP